MTRLGVAAEAAADARIVRRLTDRLIRESVPWIDDETIDSCRTWCGIGSEDAWLDVHRSTHLARARGIRFYGHFGGEPGAADALMHRASLLLFAALEPSPALVVIARDLDGDPERKRGFEQAAGEREWPFRIVGALAQPEIEAWLIIACRTDTAESAERHASLRQELGFDPIANSELLSSTAPGNRREAKQVLQHLLGGADAIQQLDAMATEVLSERGKDNGLADFLRALLVELPLVFHR